MNLRLVANLPLLMQILISLVSIQTFATDQVVADASGRNDSRASLTADELENIRGWRTEIARGNGWIVPNSKSLLYQVSMCRYPSFALDVPGEVPRGKVVLTFDDGPNRETTPAILDTLARHGVKATFFVTGRRVPGNEDILDRMLREGHIIANHSYSHPNFRQLNQSQTASQLNQTDELISNYFGGRPRFVRFPYGNSTCRAESVAGALGLHIVGWDVDSCDWDFAGGAARTRAQGGCLSNGAGRFSRNFVGWVVHETDRLGGGVVLMHDIHRQTARHLDQLIRQLGTRYEFVSLDSGDIPEFSSTLPRRSR